MKHLYKVLIVGLLLMMSISASFAQAPTQANVYENPEDAIMHYINTLNLGDYQTAYSIITPQNQSYEQFVAGYGETERIVPYFGQLGAAAGSIYVTTVLLGYQTDATVETYYGYYQLANAGNYDPSLNGYVLSNANFQLIKEGTAPQNGTISTLVNAQWDPNTVLPPEITSISEMSTDEADTLLDYYDLINARDFWTAYQQWLTPAHGLAADYRTPYNQWVIGYDDTLAVTVYTGQVQGIPANQQRAYLNSYLPTVLVAEHTDGSFVSYSGCYAIGDLSTSEQGIINGRFYWLSDEAPDANTIFAALNSLNCATLGIGI